VAVGNYCDNSKESCLLTSGDGLSWTVGGTIPALPNSIVTVLRTQGLFIAGGSNEGSRSAGLWTSADGTSWELQGDQPAFDHSGCAADEPAPSYVYELYATDSVIVAEGQDECGSNQGPRAAWHSPDGVTWERVADPQMFQVAKNNGVYVGEDGRAGVSWSTDGLTWSEPSYFGESVAVAAISTGFIVVTSKSPGMTEHRVLTSSDGQTWTDQPNVLVDVEALHLSSDGSRAVVIEPSPNDIEPGAIWASSSDGTSWTRHALPSGQDAIPAAVAIVGNRVVVVGMRDNGSSVLWVTDAP
jgi:hypothetical protein